MMPLNYVKEMQKKETTESLVNNNNNESKVDSVVSFVEDYISNKSNKSTAHEKELQRVVKAMSVTDQQVVAQALTNDVIALEMAVRIISQGNNIETLKKLVERF